MAATTSARPPLQSRDTPDPEHLHGKLAADGTAVLSNGTTNSHTNGDVNRMDQQADSDDASEDYDRIELDQDAHVSNTRASLDESTRPSGTVVDTNQDRRGVNERKIKRLDIEVTLEKTGGKGRYVLKADDPEIRDILRKGLERESLEASNKKPRSRFRDLVFTRQFTAFDRQNPAAAESPFFGFFTLFWIAMVLMFVQVSMHNWRTYGSVLGNQQILKLMFSRDIFLLAVTDGVMCGATLVTYLLQVAVARGYIVWAKSGWILQNVWQSFYLFMAIWTTWYRDWPWTHTIFITLHALVFLMKQHSFSSYNGYLSGVRRRRALLERKLKQLQDIEPISSPKSPTGSRSNSGVATTTTTTGFSKSSPTTVRRPSLHARNHTNLYAEKSDVGDVAKAIESGQPLSYDQMQAFEGIFREEIADLTRELQGKSETPARAYPANLSVFNFGEFICFPTLVYELDYPRQERINWWYVAEKTTATFGVLGVMMVISQAFLYPPIAKTVAMKEAGVPFNERLRELPFVVSDMLFPLLIEQILTWYVIWECILNVLAEVTLFADRGFYGDWWNSVSWDQYAREWNRPVHQFLLRHVYHSSISTFHLSKYSATFVTFLLSALVHELCMAVMFKKVRLYLFWLQILQIPLAAMSRSKFLKGRTILGNTIFWIGLFVGPSLLTSLYLIL